MAAMEAYRTARGTYPLLIGPDIRVVELKRELTNGGFMVPESGEASEVDRRANYVTVNGKSYVLLFYLDPTAERPSDTPCVVEVGRSYIPLGDPRPVVCLF